MKRRIEDKKKEKPDEKDFPLDLFTWQLAGSEKLPPTFKSSSMEGPESSLVRTIQASSSFG